MCCGQKGRPSLASTSPQAPLCSEGANGANEDRQVSAQQDTARERERAAAGAW